MTTIPAPRHIGSGLVPPPADRRPLARLFAFALALMLVANASNLFLYPFSIDAENYTFNFNPVDFVASGRWALSLLAAYVMPHAAIPVVPLLVACASISLAYAVTVYTWEPRIGWPHYLAAPLAVCHPLLFQVFSFSVISYAVGLAILCCAAAFHLLNRPSAARFAAGIVLFAFAFGVYQPVALFPCAAFLVGAGLNLAREGLRRTLLLALVFGACVVLAAAISQGINALLFKHYGMTYHYTDSYYDIPHLQEHPLGTLRDTLLFARPIVFGRGGPFISNCRIYEATIVCAGLLALAGAARARRGIARPALGIGLVFGAVLFSVLPPLVTAGELPWRVFLGTPVALAGVVFCAGRIRLRPARALMGLLVACSFLAFAEIGARLTYSSTMVWLNDRALGEAILEKVDTLGDLPARRPIPIEFVGFHDWPKSDQIIDVGGNSTMGSSFFAWDDGNPGRIIEFLKTLGRFDLALIAPEQRAAMRPRVDAMPDWPRPGSVGVVDGVVVVHFGPYSDFQEATMFPSAPSPAR